MHARFTAAPGAMPVYVPELSKSWCRRRGSNSVFNVGNVAGDQYPTPALCPRSESNRDLRFTKAALRLGAARALRAAVESDHAERFWRPLSSRRSAQKRERARSSRTQPPKRLQRVCWFYLGGAPPIRVDRGAGGGRLDVRALGPQAREGAGAEALGRPVHLGP